MILLLVCACAESDEIIRHKLDIVLKDDLRAILEGDGEDDPPVAADALIDNPRFELIEYRKYDEGAYSRLVIADFHFLKPVGNKGLKITRKYRYHKRFGMWDRYYNKYYTVILDGESVDGIGSIEATEATKPAIFDGEPVRAVGGRSYGPGIEMIRAAETANETADDKKK